MRRIRTLSYKEIFQNLKAAIDEVVRADPEEQKAILRELGHDPEQVLRNGAAQMAELQAKMERKIKAEKEEAP